MEKVMKKYF